MDLCVEKEALKQEIEDKNKLLEDAYVALDSLDQEKEREKEFFERQIYMLTENTAAR